MSYSILNINTDNNYVIENKREIAYCSDCGYRADQHPIVTHDERCNNRFDADSRYLDDGVLDSVWAKDTDLTFLTNANGIPWERLSGNGVEEPPSWWDQFDTDFFRDDVKVGSTLDRYVDREPIRYGFNKNARVPYRPDYVIESSYGTVTLEDYRQGKRPSVPQYNDPKNAYVEGLGGFMIQEVLDETLTRKFHARLLNVFRSHGTLRCGSMAIKHNVDKTVTVRCVKCEQTHTFSPDAVEASTMVPLDPKYVLRTAMEDFTYAVIRHGNNHAAKWLREKPGYYKVHTFDCDLTCDKNDARCRPAKVSA